MQSPPFIGRKQELRRLEGLFSKKSASIVVLRGRRRIGKSRLLSEFGKQTKCLLFSGLAPTTKTTALSQKKTFTNQLARVGIPSVTPDDWENMFWHLSKQTTEGPVLIILDEISWMGGKDPNFLGKLKNAWDMYFSKNPNLILALCGSVSSWIEENILNSTGFVGRITIDMVLNELPLSDCKAFWHPKENLIAPYEKLKLLSVTGGIPLYLEQIRPELSAEENISNLCFTAGGLLVREFEEIFSDLFSKKKRSYKEIIKCLANGPKTLGDLCKKLKKNTGGTYSKYLDDLIKAGFIKRDFSWDIDTGKESRQNRYRLSDNYLRFYLKYIEPNLSKIEKGDFQNSMPTHLPGWVSMMGLQFENLVVHNRKMIWQLLNISAEDVAQDGPFFQTTTKKQPGCQVDYMIQTRFQNLYLIEIKFSKDSIGNTIIKEMEEKRARLKTPKAFSIRPVLVHVNGVDESVVDEQYFDKIIDFSQFFS